MHVGEKEEKVLNVATKEFDAQDSEENIGNGSAPELIIKPGDIVQGEHANYKVSRLRGEGRCCVVYSGETINSAEPVAIKVFRCGSIYHSAAEREHTILKRLNNTVTTAVTFFEAVSFKGLTCFIFEMLDLNLRQLIMKNCRNGLPAWTVQKFATDVINFLQCLHQIGYVHGDLKPGNIMWSGQEGHFKCFDFGLSFHVNAPHVHTTQSAGYRAPEVVAWNQHLENTQKKSVRNSCLNGFIRHNVSNNNNPTSYQSTNRSAVVDEASVSDRTGEQHQLLTRPGPESDLWAFGCLLFEAVVGRKLYRSGDKLSSALRSDQLVELRMEEVHDRFVADGQEFMFHSIKDLLLRCLVADPRHRISALNVLQHPALSAAVSTCRQDFILPSPVLRLSPSLTESSASPDDDMFSQYGHVLGIKRSDDGRQVFVRYNNLGQATRAKNYLFLKERQGSEGCVVEQVGLPTCTPVEQVCATEINSDFDADTELLLAKAKAPTFQPFLIDFFPIELWNKL